jgi:hypothetical protein
MPKLNDPPARPGWLSPLRVRAQRATFLIRDHLQRRIETMKDRAEASKIRAFLRAYDRATASGNPAGVELFMEPASNNPRAALSLPAITGVGPIVFLSAWRSKPPNA